MSWVKHVTFFCDECDNFAQTDHVYVKRARKNLKGRGWDMSGDRDLCPECAEEEIE